MQVSSRTNMCFLLPVLTVPVKYRITENEPLLCHGWNLKLFRPHHMISEMTIDITTDRQIEDIQKDFSYVFPYLKIEFFKNGSTRRAHYSMEKVIGRNQRIKEAWYTQKNEGAIDVNDTMTVAQFEKALMEHFGLSVQLFRRSGNLWLQTSITDNWTLKQQNDHGREISPGHHRYNPDEKGDYDLNREPL